MARKRSKPAAHQPNLVSKLDARLSNCLFVACSGVPRWAYKLLEWGGDGLVWLPLTFAALLLPVTPPAARTLWANFLLGLLLDLALVGTLKGTFRRCRPVYNNAADFLLVVAVDHYSFPSGHSSRASFVAMFAAACLQRLLSPALQLAVVAWAVITALSRAAMGRHYLGDVLAGLCVGVLNAAIVTKGQFSLSGTWLDQPLVEDLYSRLAAYLQPLLGR